MFFNEFYAVNVPNLEGRMVGFYVLDKNVRNAYYFVYKIAAEYGFMFWE
jgi:hypothetical protein